MQAGLCGWAGKGPRAGTGRCLGAPVRRPPRLDGGGGKEARLARTGLQERRPKLAKWGWERWPKDCGQADTEGAGPAAALRELSLPSRPQSVLRASSHPCATPPGVPLSHWSRGSCACQLLRRDALSCRAPGNREPPLL